MSTQSLQQQFAPDSICYGCGPANAQGLHVNSYVDNNCIIAHWLPQSHHQAFPGVLNGGIIGSILDCHCNWAAGWYYMQQQQLKTIPSTVTAEYQIKLLRPTPTNTELTLNAKLGSINNKKITIDATLTIGDSTYASCKAVFVVVNSDHPGFHRN